MAVFRLLIRKASQPPVVPAISAVWVASEGLCQSLCGYSAYISRYRRVREFHPRLIVTGAGVYRGRWRKTFDLHLRSGFWLKIIYQNKSMLTNGPDVNIVALGIHAFKPRRVFLDFSTIPFTFHHLAGLLVTNSGLQPLRAQGAYLPLESDRRPVRTGFRCSATACGSSCIWFMILGGASQSQKAVTSIAVTAPVRTVKA